MQFPADFGIVLSYGVFPPARPGRLVLFVCLFVCFFLGHLLIFVDLLLQNTAHILRVQMRIEFPEGNMLSTSSDIPRRHDSSLEDDQIGCSRAWC